MGGEGGRLSTVQKCSKQWAPKHCSELFKTVVDHCSWQLRYNTIFFLERRKAPGITPQALDPTRLQQENLESGCITEVGVKEIGGRGAKISHVLRILPRHNSIPHNRLEASHSHSPYIPTHIYTTGTQSLQKTSSIATSYLNR